MDYPQARRSDHVDFYFGEPVEDPYQWMEDIDSPETKAWVAAERALTASELAKIPARPGIHRRLSELFNTPRISLPIVRGARTFYTRNDGLQNQAVLLVADGPGAAPRILIDPNTLSTDGTVALRVPQPSDDGSLLAYGLAVGGSDWVDLHVRDVATGQDLADVLHWVKFSGISWTHDGKGFFYCRYPEAKADAKLFNRLSGRRLCYHRIGTPQSADTLVLEYPEHADWFFSAEVSDDGRYLVLTEDHTGRIQNGASYMDMGDPMAPRVTGTFLPIFDNFDAAYGFLGSSGKSLYFTSTKGASRGSIVSWEIGRSSPNAATVLVGEQPDSMEHVAYAGGRFVVSVLHDVASRILVFGADGSPKGEVPLPGIGAVSGLAGRASDPVFYYGYSSFLTPASVLSRNLDTAASGVLQEAELRFDASRYETTQVFFASRDGTRIPLFITAKKGLKRDGSTPAWLYGYGGFNVAITPAYAVPPIVWLEMGGLYAQASLRGGAEYGEQWHLAGTKERKQNVFDDFIGAADFLVREGYTSRDRLLVEGRSNGGLLVGAVLNQRPDLCAVGLPGVGVMDMLKFHTFTVGAPWVSDYGSSDEPDGFQYLRVYSPVHTVREGVRYPAVLVTTGDHDDRVFPAHSYKYAAQMQHTASETPGSGPILIRIDSNAGHGGSSGSSPVSKVIDEWTDKLGFVTAHMPAGSLAVPEP